MTWIDYAIAAVVAANSLKGFLCGLRRQAFSLLAWLAALLVGVLFSADLGVLLKARIGDPDARLAAAFVALCLASKLFAALMGLLLRPPRPRRRPSLLGRLGGLALGAGQGAVLVGMAVLLAGLSVLPQTPWWRQSALLPPFQAASVWLAAHLETAFTRRLRYPH